MMTKEEALNKIKELEEYISNIDNKVGFKDDEIFLLSTEEYEKYKDVIPHINTWWWLRSPGSHPNSDTGVDTDGSVNYIGYFVDYTFYAIRPALRISQIENGKTTKIGKGIIKYNFPWIKIDKDLAIAEVPIAFGRFDLNSNDYENSEVRQFLLNWEDGR